MLQDIFLETAEKYSAQDAVTDGAIKLTYNELFLRKERVKEYFVNGLHLQNTDKIALFLPNCIDLICAFFASADIGAVTIPLNIHLKEKELQYYVNKCGISTVITLENLMTHWGRTPQQMKEVRFVFADQLSFPLQYSEPRFTQKKGPLSSDALSPDTEVLYLSSSGSTGRPKIIPKAHLPLIAGANSLGEALQITSKDRFLGVAPLFHANGFENCMLLPLLRGASVVLMRQFSPRELLKLVEQESITVLIGSPFIFSSLADLADKKQNLASVRLCLSTGAPLPGALKKLFYDEFGINIRQHYGSSETGPLSVQTEDCHEEGTVGRPFKNIKVKILDDDNRELPPGRTGEVLIRSNSMIKGYLDEPELNRESFSEGFFRTGDIGMLDLQGNIRITGRKKFLINAAGIKIDPVEIKNVLLLSPHVKDALVTGVKNRRGLEMVKAIVVPRTDCTVHDIIIFCKERLAGYKIPRIIEFRDSLPSDIMGKVIWSEL